MAWFDIAAGVAGGLNRGLGQLQEDLQQRKENTRRDAADKRQQAEELRAARADRERQIAEQISRDNPDDVSPETVAFAGNDAVRYFRKGPDGKWKARMDPLAEKTRKVTDLELDTKQERSATAMAAERTWNNPETRSKLSDAALLQAGMTAGKKLEEIVPFLKDPNSVEKFMPSMMEIAARNRGAEKVAAITAAGMMPLRQANAAADYARIGDMSSDNFQKWLDSDRGLRLGAAIMRAKTPEERIRAEQQARAIWLATLPGGGTQAPAAPASPGGSGGDAIYDVNGNRIK